MPDITPEELRTHEFLCRTFTSMHDEAVVQCADKFRDAADTIDRLQKQVERLTSAAKMLLDSYDDPDAENKSFPDALYSGVSYRSLLTLRAALQEKSNA